MKVRTMKKFTCDALIRLSTEKRKAATHKPNATTDERKPTDLNEIHRRFWAKLAGKE
jgi:hypothetical protein